MKTVCVTGHRPAKLPWGYKKKDPITMSISSPLLALLLIILKMAMTILLLVWLSASIWTLPKLSFNLGSITTLTSSWNALSPVRIRP